MLQPGPGTYDPSYRQTRKSVPSHRIPKQKNVSQRMNVTPDPTTYNTVKPFGEEAINVQIGDNRLIGNKEASESDRP